jgi:single-stranded DNA-binding protein
MSLFLLATGTLIADPQRRISHSGRAFVTATLRTPTEEEAALVSLICFDPDACAGLLNLKRGDSCGITGRAKLTTWTKDGEQRHGLSVVAEGVMTLYALGKRRIVTARDAKRARSLHWEGGEMANTHEARNERKLLS